MDNDLLKRVEELEKKINYLLQKQIEKVKYFNNGTKSLHYFVDTDGKYHGMYRSWYKSGLIKEEGEYVHHKKNGTWKHWFSNGNLEYVVNYINGVKHGNEKKMFINKTIQSDQNYHYGTFHGSCSWWEPTGKLIHTHIYDNGKLIEHS